MKNNPRITKKERGLLRGSIRRVFSMSDMRRAAVAATVVRGYRDPKRPRVSRWSVCPLCKQYTPSYDLQVDHIEPVVPLDIPADDMGLDYTANRTWCDPSNLQAICKPCHKAKSRVENKQRRRTKR